MNKNSARSFTLWSSLIIKCKNANIVKEEYKIITNCSYVFAVNILQGSSTMPRRMRKKNKQGNRRNYWPSKKLRSWKLKKVGTRKIPNFFHKKFEIFTLCEIVNIYVTMQLRVFFT